MKKLTSLVACAAVVLSMTACSSQTSSKTETLTGVGEGYGGEITVTVTKQGDKIVKVEAVGDKETNGVGSEAIEKLPQKIVDANSTEVEVISGATYSSKGLIYAVNNAIDPAKYPYPTKEEAKDPANLKAAKVYQGFGLSNMGRLGPGKDDKDVQVYSFNNVFAHTLFDENGKILSLYVDIVEVASPNYDGDGMPHFSGFPGQGGYNFDSNHDEKVDSKTVDSEDNFLSEVNGWQTKRERGEGYKVGGSTWTEQMNAFEEVFVGKTIEEVEQWFEKYTSDVNGRPLKADSDKPGDQEKYKALGEDDKKMLADITSSATMSLKDAHGDIIAAIKKSFENRVPLDVKEIASQGTAVLTTPRIGPGKDDKGVSVYSINEVFANTLFDKDGKISAIYVDILEVATPNYDGAEMPHLSGLSGQIYNNDSNHDEKVDGQITATDDSFLKEVESWTTKRERGNGYKLNSATWTDEMNKFQEIFVGKTVEEVEAWFAKYTSDVNGRPLKADSDKPEDQTKYKALSEDDKKMLADITSSATMSLKDPHGDIIGAIKKSFENKIDLNLTIK